MGDEIPIHALMDAPQKMTYDAGFRGDRCGWKGISMGTLSGSTIAFVIHSVDYSLSANLIAPTVWGEIEIYSFAQWGLSSTLYICRMGSNE